jgi:hypothetical protein
MMILYSFLLIYVHMHVKLAHCKKSIISILTEIVDSLIFVVIQQLHRSGNLVLGLL